MIDHSELLATAVRTTARLAANQKTVVINGKRVKLATEDDVEVSLPNLTPGNLPLTLDDDPFGGNENNRRVAARMRRDNEQIQGKVSKKAAGSSEDDSARTKAPVVPAQTGKTAQTQVKKMQDGEPKPQVWK